MITPRKLNSSHPMNKLVIGTLPSPPPRVLTEGQGLARTGAPKRVSDIPVSPGMKRQTKGELAAYHHGQAVDDTPNTVKSFESKIPLHPSTTDAQRAALHPVVDNANEILKEASNLGPHKA